MSIDVSKTSEKSKENQTSFDANYTQKWGEPFKPDNQNNNGHTRSVTSNDLSASAPPRLSFLPSYSLGAALPAASTEVGKKNHAYVNELHSILNEYCDVYYDTVKNKLYRIIKPQFITERLNTLIERIKVASQQGKPTVQGIEKTLSVLGHEPLNDKEKSFVGLLIQKKYMTKENIHAAYMQVYKPITDANGQRISKTPEEWTNGDFSTVLIKAKNMYGKTISQDMFSALLSSNHIPKKNPIIAFYEREREKYPSDPGIIDQLIDCINTDTPHTRTLIKVWLAGFGALVAKEKHPPRLALVFTGNQGTGKTEFFRNLLPDQIKPYFAESTFDRGKDDELLLCQNLLVLNDEWMGKTAKSDPEKLKSIISKSAFDMRVPYGKTNETFSRLAMIAGTSNQREILNDPTGNSRMIPVNILSIDFQKINSIDRKHLFCEIMDLYLSGYRYMLNSEDREHLKDISLLHTTANVTREMLEKYFKPITTKEYKLWVQETNLEKRALAFPGIDIFTATDVMNDIHRMHPKLNISTTHLGRELFEFTHQVRRVKNNAGTQIEKGYILERSPLNFYNPFISNSKN